MKRIVANPVIIGGHGCRLLNESSEGRYGSSVWPSDGVLLRRYPFLCAQVLNLTLGDASQLLTEYKEIILKYEILELALKRRVRKAQWNGEDSCVLPELDPELVNNTESAETDRIGDHAKDVVQPAEDKNQENGRDIEVCISEEPSGSNHTGKNHPSTSVLVARPSEIEGLIVEGDVYPPTGMGARDDLVNTADDPTLDMVQDNNSVDFKFHKNVVDLDPGDLIDLGSKFTFSSETMGTRESSATNNNQPKLLLE